MVTATFFVIGNILGAGLVAIPYGAKLAGWLSIPFFVFIPIITCCCGVLLAKSVNMTVANDRRDVSREPYPQLAKEAVGNKTRKFVVVTLYCGQIMSCLVFLLLAGEILSKLIPFHFGGLSSHNELRVWISITIGFIIPFNLLGSPKDFWGIALVATVTSVVTAIFMCTCLGMVHYNNVVQAHTPPLDIENVFASFGIIVFSFSGVGIFPTVQGDMKEPDKFPKVVVIGFTTLSVVYVSVALTAFFVLGNFIGEDLLTTLSSLSIYHKIISYKAFVTISQVLILGHVLSAFVLQMNPVYQLVEVFFKTPNGKFLSLSNAIQSVIIGCEFIKFLSSSVAPSFKSEVSICSGQVLTDTGASKWKFCVAQVSCSA